MPDKSLINNEADDKLQALLSNANAARVISQTIEGTLGPKGLDIMLVDGRGEVVISNDGVTILKLMAVSHPAARMIINAARAQQEEAGDGTTTATILAGALVAEGANQVIKGVPVTQVIQGIQLGIQRALEVIGGQARQVDSLDDPLLYSVALTAARGQADIAQLIIKGARIIGQQTMLSPDYKFTEAVTAREYTDSQVFVGTLLNKVPLNQEMPRQLQEVRILAVDDNLAPEDIDSEARGTEAGFQYYLEAKQRYQNNLRKICDLGVNLVLVDRSVDALGEQMFTEAGIMVIQRVSQREMEQICRHTGTRRVKRIALDREAEQLAVYLGQAVQVQVDDRLRQTSVLQGSGQALATIVIGAATEEVVDERERIARDAAAAVQAALRKGVVPGGGAIELWAARQLDDLAQELKGLASYGAAAVKEALLRPFACMATNAGFNPLEKMADVIAAQKENGQASISVDCDTGALIDVWEHGVVDPTLVKHQAVKTAGEVAAAILRINTIIKMQNDSSYYPDNAE